MLPLIVTMNDNDASGGTDFFESRAREPDGLWPAAACGRRHLSAKTLTGIKAGDEVCG